MLRSTSVLPAFATRLLLQVGGSVAATLIASAIVTAVPRSDAAAPAQAELTSGGKYAARVPGGEGATLVLADLREPLPVLTRVPAQPIETAALPDVKAIDSAKVSDAVPHVAKQRSRPAASAKAEPRRPAEVAAAVATSEPRAIASSPDLAKAEDGFLPRVTSAAHSAWTFTTSTGSSLLSHLMP